MRQVHECTARFEILFLVGFNERRGDKLLTTVAVIDRGHVLGTYRKAFPGGYFTPGREFPFDPTLVPLPDGRVRLYFTSLRGRRFDESTPAIYSAISAGRPQSPAFGQWPPRPFGAPPAGPRVPGPFPPGPPAGFGGDGPWNHRVLLATSKDDVSWTVSSQVLAERVSVSGGNP